MATHCTSESLPVEHGTACSALAGWHDGVPVDVLRERSQGVSGQGQEDRGKQADLSKTAHPRSARRTPRSSLHDAQAWDKSMLTRRGKAAGFDGRLRVTGVALLPGGPFAFEFDVGL